MNRVSRILNGRVLDASLVLAIALLAGRVSGIVREFLLASSLGISTQADLAVLLLTLPDLLVGLLLAGGLSAALVPRFRRLDKAASATLFRYAALFATGAFTLVGLFLVIAPDLVFLIFAPGMTYPAGLVPALTPALVAIALPLTAASGVVTAFLNAHDRYFVAGLGTLIFNLAVIAGLFAGGSMWTLLWHLSLGIAAGAFLRLLSQLVIIPRSAWRHKSQNGIRDRSVTKAFIFGVGASGLLLMAPILVRAAASFLGSGTIAAFNYAQKITELPTGVLITTISTVALTSFGGLIANDDERGLRRQVSVRLRQSLLTAIGVVAFGTAFAYPFVRVFLGDSALTSDDLDRVAALTIVSLTSVPFVAVSSISAALLNARLRTNRVFAVNGMAAAALPFLVLPGILIGSDIALMASVTAFQCIVAVLLANAAGIKIRGEIGFATRRLVVTAGGILLLAALLVLFVVWAHVPDWAALGMGGVGFLIAMIATRRGTHEEAF